ncbi:MAG: hypothetical protein PGN23_17295 [Sphingomonas adhaesiva]|uniref:hypothetical protein n=1 Tax=Sphingomonas adhaesiva TaxID=28212 RepID=UPI002FF7EE73
MRDTYSTARLFAIGLAAMLATLALMVALPHDRYVRWQDERTEAYARLGWVYERVHYDRTPTDIVLVGTSHTMNGLDGLAIAQRIAATGARAADGRCLTVSNLAIPSYGRNLHWAIVHELLSARKPRALVLEVFENETRKAHPMFWRVADSADLVRAPILLNQNYVGDLIRLPYRQLKLAVESAAPAQFGLKPAFSLATYDGSTVDNTRIVNVHGQAFTPPLTRVLDPVTLEAAAASRRENKNLNMLPAALERFEYAVPRHYVAALLAEADKAGVPVILLYLPGYGMPPRPFDMRLFRGRPMMTVNDLLRHREFWHDPDHLNAQGATAVSRRVADLLAPRVAAAPTQSPTPAGGCDFGVPPRPITIPFRKQQ